MNEYEQTKKRDYLWLLDILPALAVGQFCSKWFLTVYHGSPEASGWVAAISLALGGAVGFVLCKYLRMQATKNMQSRGNVLLVSISISLGLSLTIVTTTVFLTKPHEISYEEATAATPIDQSSVEPDAFSTALQQIKSLANQGSNMAQYQLGLAYAWGRGVTQDYQEALRWFRLSAAQGNPEAQNALGLAYNQGWAVAQDYQEALKWYRLAAAQGNLIAQNNIGDAYANGHGVPRDSVQAMAWYLIAIAGGETVSAKDLQQLESNATPAQIAEAQRMAREWGAAHHPAN